MGNRPHARVERMSDGLWPSDGLARFGDKKLVGMTQHGGTQGAGVIYTINP